MYQYGIVRWDPKNIPNEDFRTTFVGAKFPPDEHPQPPNALFFEDAGRRDHALQELCGQYPGVMFCPFNVDKGFIAPPGDITAVSISEKGVLPL